jgi:transcriptional regulator with XRE-family HTH domain
VNGWDRVIAAAIARRSELGLTQKELAVKAGVAERTVQNLEAGKRPQPLIRGKIERALGWPSGEMERVAAGTDRGPEPVIPPDVLRVIQNAPRDDQWKRDAIEALEAIERGRRAGGQSAREQRAG